MRVYKIFVVLLLLLFPAILAGCEEKKEVKTVDWYMAPDNEGALEAMLKACNNNPGELRNDPNCQNATQAQHKLFVTKPAKPIEFNFKRP